MIKNVDGENIEMTPEEIADLEELNKQFENQYPTKEELLQTQIDELKKTIISMSAEI